MHRAHTERRGRGAGTGTLRGNIPRRATRERRSREAWIGVLQAKELCFAYAVAMVVTKRNGAPCGH